MHEMGGLRCSHRGFSTFSGFGCVRQHVVHTRMTRPPSHVVQEERTRHCIVGAGSKPDPANAETCTIDVPMRGLVADHHPEPYHSAINNDRSVATESARARGAA